MIDVISEFFANNVGVSIQFAIPGIFVLVIIMVCLAIRGRRSPETIQGVATLLGIAGTFVGIVYALYGLDVYDVSSSVSKLLDGIYPAFLSSLFGVIMSLSVYLFPRFWRDKRRLPSDDIGPQILHELKTMNDNLGDFVQKVTGELGEVIKGLGKELQDSIGDPVSQLDGSVEKLIELQKEHERTLERTEKELSVGIKSVMKVGLEDLTGKLKAISEVLVKDYSSVQDAIREIKEMKDAVPDRKK
ncbi:MAG: MotA/TolQ/ExbB proton channel family protein [Candidatus Kaiserbacteria bacterium]|nr:MotA/TolQ/ExbB proton channel family protein [Candidatus Kaiserbacteria bacterium]